MKDHILTLPTTYFKILYFLLFFTPSIGVGQIAEADSLSMMEVIADFQESIVQKDSVRFNKLFFNHSVNFVGIMSKQTEWYIKKDFPDFQGVAVSDHKSFITDICQSDKKELEKFYNIELSTDGVIGSISFGYAFLSDGRMIQWGNEKWNMVKDGEEWLITDVIYSIHFPDVEPFPFE